MVVIFDHFHIKKVRKKVVCFLILFKGPEGRFFEIYQSGRLKNAVFRVFSKFDDVFIGSFFEKKV
jgi:hypothetical protein